jgi:stalled ribosome rescue protein Dom34
MALVRKLGIWMDHSSARLIEFSMDLRESETQASKFTHEEKEKTWGKNELLMHHKEQHEQAAFYKNLAESIKGYDEVVIFGPTDAKSEFMNTLKKDHHFDKMIIEVRDAGKLTENQQQAFVRDYFSKKVIRF